eukprot:GFUD01068870.1.p1 GENE.GFUD01068870.1~~GFUD01068870.1.p1  ORF type:complete len:145 (-),score=18.60 GFUD01068870.1:51-485(-)
MEKKIVKIGSLAFCLLLFVLFLFLSLQISVWFGIIMTIIIFTVSLVIILIKLCLFTSTSPESVYPVSYTPQTTPVHTINTVHRPTTLYNSVYIVQSPGTIHHGVYQTRIAENTLPSAPGQETRQTTEHPPDNEEPPAYEIAIYM